MRVQWQHAANVVLLDTPGLLSVPPNRAVANAELQRASEAVEALERYRELTTTKIERNAKLRREKLANSTEERQRTLQAIEEDRLDRKERAEKLAR